MIAKPLINSGPTAACACWLLAAALFTGMVHAEDVPELPKPTPPDAEYTLTTGLWLARLGGDVRQRQSPRRVLDLQDDLDLRNMEATFAAELSIRKHDFFDLHLGGFQFSTDSHGSFPRQGAFGELEFDAGDAFRSSFDLTNVSAEMHFHLFKPYGNNNLKYNSDARERVRFRFSPLIGVRYVDVDHRVSLDGGGRVDTGGEWLGLYGGLNFELMFRPDTSVLFFDRMSLEGGAAFGPAIGGDGGNMWHVRVNFRSHINNHLAVIIGYRLVGLNVENDGYELNAGPAGLFLGASLHF